MHLGQLVIIRFLLILALLFACWIVHDHTDLPLLVIAGIIAALTVFNLASIARLRTPGIVSHHEVAAHLLVDILAVAILAYFTGGVSNPFLAYMLVPVCIAATVLPGHYAWGLSGLTILCYGVLLVWHQPLTMLGEAHAHAHHTQSMNVHLIGMWINFTLSALLISFFVVRMSASVRRHQTELNAVREEDLRNEQLIAVATQAAGIAHEMGTPLSTIKVILSDLAPTPDTQEDIQLLRQQISVCSEILQRLRQRADLEQLTNPPATGAMDYCQQLLEHWQLLRPDINTSHHFDRNLEGKRVRIHPTIEQGVINVLNNAAEVSQQGISIAISSDEHFLCWNITDSGEGFSDTASSLAGKRPVTTKPDGMGIGLFLTHASIQRYGGQVTTQRANNGGTTTIITLPLVTQ